jgi:AraC family transcriptional regulator
MPLAAQAPPQLHEPVSEGIAYPPGHWFDVRRWDTPTFTAMYLDYERDFPIQGVWQLNEFHYFDLSLSGRPAGSRGYFPDQFCDYQNLGRLFFVPAGYRYHGEGMPGRQQNLVVYLRAQHALSGQEEFGENLPAVLRDCMQLRSEAIKEILYRIYREVNAPDFAMELLLEGLGTTLLAETIRLLHNLRQSATRKGGLSPWRMKAIEDRIGADEVIPSLNELAELCRLSRRQLMRAFREETGKTIGAYVQQKGFEKAKRMLRNSQEPIGRIAAQLGFASAAVFSTAFRRATNETPSRYRAARNAREIQRQSASGNPGN